MLRVLPLLFVVGSTFCARVDSAQAEVPLRQARSAHATLVWNHDLLAELGLAVDPEGNARAPLDPQFRAVDLELSGRLGFALEDGHVVRIVDGSLAWPRGLTIRSQERAAALAPLRLRASNRDDVALDLVDAQGRAWFSVQYVHQFAAPDHVQLANLDLRIAAGLARWAHRPELRGIAVGALHLDLPLPAAAKSMDAVSSCEAPNWPGSPGLTTDVLLSNLSALQAQCRSGCNGTGTDPNAEVKLSPSVDLYNAGTTEVPWYTKFSTTTPPGSYPYASVDQHPYLVWNAYRINALGQLEQIGRSGLKHAFATANTGCTCSDPHILAPECADTYLNFTNDVSYFLAPRSEVIAATGVWGRCHSAFDPDCDGLEDSQGIGNFDQRLVLHESELDPAQNPGSSYQIEAWYVVRDDSNIYNSMGRRAFTPQWSSTFWSVPVGAQFSSGPVIDQWVTPGSLLPGQSNAEVVTARGRMKLAVKVSALGAGTYRYDYALMNFDFGVPVTMGAEPTLEVVRNRGLSAFVVPLAGATSISGLSFHDGDRDSANNWTTSVTPSAVRWDAPSGASLDWGSMYRFTLIANSAPQNANATLVVAESGDVGDQGVATLGPSVGDTIFADSME